LLKDGAVILDVFGAEQSRFDELDGTWLVSEQRLSLPGAVWLPETGRGTLSDEMKRYLFDNLHDLTEGDMDRTRIAAMGYSDVNWFRLGTDGWLDIGEMLEPTTPVPVNVD